VLEEDSEGVRIMTVHKAKGLEFPAVILGDMTANLAAGEPDRYVDTNRRLCATRLLRCAPWELIEHEQEERAREHAEGVRVAYVAATRARDLMVVPVVGDEELDGWVGPLNRTVYPARQRWRDPERAPGCPEFGDASVVARPIEFDREPEFSVRPGLHQPQAGEHSVVWWDPRLLRLDVPESFGVRQGEILGDSGVQAAAGLEAYRNWQGARQRAIELGSVPLFKPVRATQAPEIATAIPIDVETLPLAANRPSGRRFGALVHAILEEVDFAAVRADIAQLAQIHQRLTGATPEETAAAIETVEAVLGHPILGRARSAERRHRELPVALNTGGSRIVEGVIDLAFLEDRSWIVVDFKTTADLLSHRAEYERQLRWYALALERTTAIPAKGILLAI
jgi:ATP-dependent exoDNAse (exonuclease V) beta subunit